jgi:hypothetical protein
VYLPRVGTFDRLAVCNDVLADVELCLNSVENRLVVIAGDFNNNLPVIICSL